MADQKERRPLPHERLDVFQVALQLVALVSALPPSRGASDTFDQLRRASTSIVLNIAEGVGKQGRDRTRFYEIARGSALECAAALSVLRLQRALTLDAHDRGHDFCERIYAMLTRLVR